MQEDLAAKDQQQIDQQILANEIRSAIAARELDNHDLTISHSEEVEAFMRHRFTNQELRNWLVGQLQSVYFQSYQLAFDLARRAEKAYLLETGKLGKATGTAPPFIQPGAWDSLRKGLLAGERLQHDLRRLESAYLDEDRRELEITKHVSLAAWSPDQLLELKTKGGCKIDLTEALFDLDYPGQYLRRIKSVSLTIPCVAGPYTSVNCTLTLMSSKVRWDPTADGSYRESVGSPPGSTTDARFAYDVTPTQSIATSSGQNDTGLFELSFHDEKYVPFEYSGAISTWSIELPPETNRFDFDSITDVVLQVQYTARDGGGSYPKGEAAGSGLRGAAWDAVVKPTIGGARLFSARHDFAAEWYRYTNPSGDALPMSFSVTPRLFPYQVPTRHLSVSSVELFAQLHDPSKLDPATSLTLSLKTPTGETVLTAPLAIDSSLLQATIATPLAAGKETGTWTFSATLTDGATSTPLPPAALDNVFFVFHYKWSALK